METMVKPPRTGMEAFQLMPEGTYCQLINNALIMSPAPLVKHAGVLAVIFNQLFNYAKINQSGYAYTAPVDVYLNKKNVFQSDIFFISTEKKDIIQENGIYGAPDLVIEILSSDRKYDLITKKAVYEQAGVQEYWVVDPETKWCEGFVLDNGVFRSLGESTGRLVVNMFNLTIEY